MFRKSADPKSLQRLSGAGRKKFRKNVKDKFPLVSDPDLDLLLPPKAEITLVKFQNRVLVYAVEGGFPMFFDIDGRGTEIYPTVYALWQVAHLLPCFTVKGGEVSRFLIGGADLMFPGISIPLDGLPSFSAGEPWSVKVPGNPAPIAVGTTLMSSDQALKAGLRGKALRILHCYHDLLWESVEGRFVPNAGFLEDVVFPDPSLLSMSSDSCDVHPLNDQQNASSAELLVQYGFTGDVQSVVGLSSASTNDDTTTDTCDKLTSKVSELKATDGSSSIEECSDEVVDQNVLSVSDVDGLLEQCLLQALHTTVKEKDLPMPGSTLWFWGLRCTHFYLEQRARLSNHVLACRPAGVTLDIKKSSDKKLSKWLQSKALAGLISVKEDKFKKEVILVAVNRSNPEYMSFKPNKQKMVKVEQTSGEVAAESQSHRLLHVEEVYKPTAHVSPIFASLGADIGGLFSASEATEIVFNYIEKENLVKSTDKAVVILDATLCDALFKGAIKKGSTYPTEIHKKVLGPTFLSRMQAHLKVIRGNDMVVKKGALKPIQIMTERRQGNKKVTKVSGFEPFLMDGESLASELQKKFACSTSVAELPGKKGLEVLIQGGVIDNLAKHLVEQYEIPKKYIEVLDKTKK